ncbi:PREDICTED: uncharacterized protein LOC108609869 isoform X1 [Drosophila arizonae]|uniref:Uncharacterized protein LOC108609869 isoform X1 n=1 Tax=Drosophila arizonae TaxID=7263 RepID=A0ABM1NQ96_DROAR|nr:PREDICTED: uncharacterized protein LOC108609869 isoform X1 [Drosophila arizonae]
MEINTTSLLPYVLDLLSRQPDLCTSVDALCEKIQDVVMDDVISPFGTLKRAVEFSVELGTNLGLLLLSDKRIRMPFNLRAKKDGKSCQGIDEHALAEGHERNVVKRLAKTLKDPRNGVLKPKTSVKKRRKCIYKQPIARPKSKKKRKLTKKQLYRLACRAPGNY